MDDDTTLYKKYFNENINKASNIMSNKLNNKHISIKHNNQLIQETMDYLEKAEEYLYLLKSTSSYPKCKLIFSKLSSNFDNLFNYYNDKDYKLLLKEFPDITISAILKELQYGNMKKYDIWNNPYINLQ